MQIHPFTIHDIPQAKNIQPEGWSDITTHLMEYCLQPFCFPIKVVEDTKLLGVGALIIHEKSAWLGHIIVDKSCRGKGVGYLIVKELLEIADQKNIDSVLLIATDLGVPLYTKAGFRQVGSYQFLKSDQPALLRSLSPNIQIASPVHYDQIRHLDQLITGENRFKLIQPHLHRAIVYEQNDRVEGYYLPQLRQGPIYADKEKAGLALMDLKYSTVDIAVIPTENVAAINHLSSKGFTHQNSSATRMVYGKEIHFQQEKVFSRIGGNYG